MTEHESPTRLKRSHKRKSSSTHSLVSLSRLKNRFTSRGHPGVTEIEYSVFKAPTNMIPYYSYPTISRPPYAEILQDVEDSIESGNDPQRISAGSSGSYFVFNSLNEIVGVFKPKDEEPYGPLSPKWTKWLHRNLFPCFFGRSCLIPNLGYVCESAAFILDQELKSGLVPETHVVRLKSCNFYYYWHDRLRLKVFRKPLPPKIGSLQLFLNGYEGADVFFEKHPLPDSPQLEVAGKFTWTVRLLKNLQLELEKLVILDYIMRNTDRGLDNWMIKIQWLDDTPSVEIAAIDSGLSFPWKHPSEWRSFPYGWLFLPAFLIGQPFSEEARRHFLPLLTSSKWWETTSQKLYLSFSQDSEFKYRMYEKQLAVLKGQAFNVVEALKDPQAGPLQLTRKRRFLVWDELMDVPINVSPSVMYHAISTPIIANPLSTINEAEPESTPLIQHEEPFGTKTVIIERLQICSSKPPVFTWC